MNELLPSLRLSWHVVVRNWTVYRKDFLANISPTLADPALILASLGMGLSGYVGQINGLSYAQFLAPGMIATTALFTAFFESSYDAAEFAIGYARIEAASDAFGGRATGMGRKESGTAGRSAAYQKLREDYASFRSIARATFPQQGDRVALSLTGDLPEDTGKFVTLATASYTQGKKPPYSEKLTKRGYPAAALDTHLTALRAFTNLAADHEEEKGNAIEDTSLRDSTYDALRAYMKELKGVAKGALRGKHDLLAKLGL
jgi:hypothetical protein